MLGYCLMTNHVHLVVIPHSGQSMARTLRRAHSEFAQSLNRAYQRSGHLWQNRFYSCILDERHLWTALRYVEQNPVRSSLVRRAEEWEWSSAREHLGLRGEGRVLLRTLEWRGRFTPEEWRQYLEKETAKKTPELEELRAATRNGWALGSPEFLSQLGHQTGRVVRPQQTGRPRETEYQKVQTSCRFATE